MATTRASTRRAIIPRRYHLFDIKGARQGNRAPPIEGGREGGLGRDRLVREEAGPVDRVGAAADDPVAEPDLVGGGFEDLLALQAADRLRLLEGTLVLGEAKLGAGQGEPVPEDVELLLLGEALGRGREQGGGRRDDGAVATYHLNVVARRLGRRPAILRGRQYVDLVDLPGAQLGAPGLAPAAAGFGAGLLADLGRLDGGQLRRHLGI